MGRPKALLEHADGGTLVEHIVKTAEVVADEVVILGQCDALPERLAAYPFLLDGVPDSGPLAGLCTLLTRAGDRWSLLLACDMPLLSPSLLHDLIAAAKSDVDAVVFGRDDQVRPYHACCALYHPRLLPAAREELTNGRRRLRTVFEDAVVTVLNPTPDQQRQLTQVNTPEEYVRLKRGK